ncbi:hypothetical protein [Nocardioides sp. SYSU DS0651]|uniref:hypothetical protein n=1 Tax=Nocardioides sp. SYSU DS0651 TaxID=3415955 RepID=UPI003F4B42B1
MRTPAWTWILMTALLLVACGQGERGQRGADEPAGASYDGPLQLSEGRHGAAGAAVDCRHGARAGVLEDAAVYAEGATSDDPESALVTARSEGAIDLPEVELAEVARDRDRVMFAHRRDGRIVAAVVVHDGDATDGAGGDGWYVESYARCDVAELGPEVARDLGYQLWTGTAGEPAPTTEVVSYAGPAHCDWQSMTFLALGERSYVRRPQPGLQEWVDGEYVDSMPLPRDAVRTGFSRGRDRLWTSPSGDRAYVGRPAAVEAWPAADLACA